MSASFLDTIIAAALADAEQPMRRASRGELDGLAVVAADAVNDGFAGQGLYRLVMLAQGLGFWRLTMAHGQSADAHTVVSLYGEIAAACRNLGDTEAADRFEGQGVLLAELLAEDGDEDMASLIAANADLVSAGGFREASRLLIHDGHLHAGFDGYYSAPKLGGMVGR